MSKLNFRQRALYNYLLERGDEWTHQLDVVYGMYDFYNFTDSNDKFHDSNARHILTKDIRAINNSDEIQKVIISSGKGIKIANEAEWEIYIRSEYKSVFSKLKRVRRKERKGLLNGQKRLVFDSERDIIEAFIKEA